MPELPDIELYCEALDYRFKDREIFDVRLVSPFLLRSFELPISLVKGRKVLGFSRMGKRVIWHLENDLFLVFHLMIAGRFHLRPKMAKVRKKIDLILFDFEEETLAMTEAGGKKRASLYLVQGTRALEAHDPGGLEVLEASFLEFRTALTSDSRTLKRQLTNPRVFSGIGNTYSDEILHQAGLSPFKRTSDCSDKEIQSLYQACQTVLTFWSNRLRKESDGFPEKVTAFQNGFAVHGKFGQPCPTCGKPVQRVVFSNNEMNYCAQCQTGGKLLSDRSLARLLKQEWPKTIEDWEDMNDPKDI